MIWLVDNNVWVNNKIRKETSLLLLSSDSAVTRISIVILRSGFVRSSLNLIAEYLCSLETVCE